MAITQWILGIRPTYTGLQISPVVPDDWDDFQIKRIFRDVTYDIQVRRVGPGSQTQITVNGEALAGNIVPLPGESISDIQVQVTLGDGIHQKQE